MAEDKKLRPVDLVGIGNLLEHLVIANMITCEERDRIIQRIANDHDFADHRLPILMDHRSSKDEVLKRAARNQSNALQYHKPDESYISLTDIARAHSDEVPGYVIQSWLRSRNTLAFLNLWEKENDPDYCEDGCVELLEKKKAASFTLTPKLWIDRTKAIGILSRAY